MTVVIDWTGYKPPPYDPEKHDPCEKCGYRITFWSTIHSPSCDRA